MRFSPPLQVLERGPGGEVSESPKLNTIIKNPYGRGFFCISFIRLMVVVKRAAAQRWEERQGYEGT